MHSKILDFGRGALKNQHTKGFLDLQASMACDILYWQLISYDSNRILLQLFFDKYAYNNRRILDKWKKVQLVDNTVAY